MKKSLLPILSLILILLLLAGCTTSAPPEDEQSTPLTGDSESKDERPDKSPDETTGPIKFDFLVISDRYSDDNVASGFASPQAHGLYTDSITVNATGIASLPLMLPWLSTQLSYVESEHIYATADSDEIGTYYSRYDQYHNDTIQVNVLSGTDLVTYYIHEYDQSENAETIPDLTDDEVKAIAEGFLEKILPPENHANLEFYSITTSVGGTGMYSVLYRRYIHGYATEETATLFITRTGKVYGYSGESIAKFDPYAETLSKELLDETYEKLVSVVEKLGIPNVTRLEGVITANTSGELYMELFVTYGDSQMTSFITPIVESDTEAE